VKRLFSPWRSEYIKTFKHEKKSTQCLFCRIAKEKKDSANLVVWRGELCYAVMNKFPYNSGHMMVVPYRHLPEIKKLSDEESKEIMRTSIRCVEALKKVSGPHGFNFGANFGRVAGAGIEHHVHFHIVPRWNGDTNFLPVLADTKLVSEDLAKLAAKLRRHLHSKT